MQPTHDEIFRILAIGHDTSLRGVGISLRDALRRSNYRELRKQFDAEALVPIIREHPELIDQWTMYCEDKRTSGGFALHGETPEVVADYVIRELDYWDRVGSTS